MSSSSSSEEVVPLAVPVVPTFGDVVGAICLLKTSPSILALTRDPKPVQALQLHERRAAVRGWALCETDDHEEARERTAATLAQLVDPDLTPHPARTASAQLHDHPTAATLRHRHTVLAATLECFEVMFEHADVATAMGALRRCLGGIVPAHGHFVDALLHRLLALHLSVDHVCVEYVALTEAHKANAALCLGVDASMLANAWACFPHMRTSSPDAALHRTLLQPDSPFHALPHELVVRIRREATASRRHAVSCALAAQRTDSADFCRAHLDECLAVVAVCSTLFAGPMHLHTAREHMRTYERSVARLERCAHRREADSAKRQRLVDVGGNTSMPTLNTLVVCDTQTSRHLRQSAAIEQRGLRVRHASGVPMTLNCALHADIVCVNPLSLDAVNGLHFHRCIVCCHVNRMHPRTYMHARHVWIMRPTRPLAHRAHPLPECEARFLGVANPHVVHLMEHVVAL